MIKLYEKDHQNKIDEILFIRKEIKEHKESKINSTPD
jgi:hypothetical protein